MITSRIPLRLVTRNLFKHPIRTLLTLGSLTVALFLLCFLRSLVVTLDAGVKSAKSDRIIVQSAVSLFVDLPQSYEGKIRAVPGVVETCGWNWFGGYYQDPSNFFAQFAVDQTTLLDVYPEIEIVDGDRETFLRERQSCLIGSELATRYVWRVGDSVPIISALYPRVDGTAWEFRVAGIYSSKSSNVDNLTIFFHYEFLEKTLEAGAAVGPPGIGIFTVKVADGTEPLDVMGRIDALFANGPQRVQSTSEAEFQAQFVSMVGNVPFFVGAIGTGVFLAILLAVVNTMLMSAREQSRDVGILKALGFGSAAVFWILLLQSLFLSVLGGGAGVALAFATSGPIQSALGPMFPNYSISVGTVVLGGAISVLIGVAAGVAPAWRLSRLSTVGSLRTEV